MNRRRLSVLLVLVAAGGAVGLLRALAPDRYETAVRDAQQLVSDVPEPVVIGVALLAVVAVWIAAMILLAKLLYWGWRQIDASVFWLWETLLPESPIVRFAAGLTIMLFVFGIGPLVFLQSSDMNSDDQVEETLGTNGTDATPAEQTTPDETNQTDTDGANETTADETNEAIGGATSFESATAGLPGLIAASKRQ